MEDGLIFASRQEFRVWLAANAGTSGGVRLVFGKCASVRTLTAGEALEEALCFGWIDGKLKSVDETRYLKHFAPRRTGSVWSEKNRRLVRELISKGLMTERGLEAVEAAKISGTWDSEKKLPGAGESGEAFAALLAGNPTAYGNFLAAPPSYRRQIMAFYFDAKQEPTRVKRLGKIIAALQDTKRKMLY